MEKSAKIYVAGHRGLVGSALIRQLEVQGYENLLTKTHSELDLTRQTDVETFFSIEKPDYIFLAAAKVGGIHANNTYPADFIRDNLSIQQNVIEASYKNNVKRLLFLGSSCIYPRDCPQPIKEEYLLTGSLESTNRPYALAKISGIEMCWAYNRQYGTQYLAVMPTNLYGAGDNYDLENSHVLPALIRKFHDAKVNNQSSVELWGTGAPRREFLYSDDMAGACVFLMKLESNQFNRLVASQEVAPLINIGYGEDLSISELAEIVKDVIGYSGSIQWNSKKPDGTPRKLLSSDKINELGWQAKIELRAGIRKAYELYSENP